MPSKTLKTLALAAVVTLLPLRAEATLSEARSFDEKVDKAASIIVGRCVSKESKWDAAHHWILTYYRFAVNESLKGFPSPEVTIVTPGGTIGNMTQDAVGIPKFEIGDEHVLFVRNTQAGPTVLYFEQGAYRVVGDVVMPTVSAAVLIDTQAGKAVSPEQPQSLRAFKSRVRETVKRRENMRMEMIEKQKKEQASILRTLQRNKALIFLALVGAVLATWQLVKRW